MAGGFILITGIDGSRYAVRQHAVAVINDADECHDSSLSPVSLRYANQANTFVERARHPNDVPTIELDHVTDVWTGETRNRRIGDQDRISDSA
jgi:hypothetical protein